MAIEIRALDSRAIASAILGYWRDCRADEAFLSVKYERVAQSRLIDDVELISGQLTTASADYVREAAMRDGVISEADASIPVLVAVGRLSAMYAHGRSVNRQHTITPLWIPAILERNGLLHADEKRHPFIARQSLDPAPGDTPIIGTQADADAYYQTHVPNEGWNESWSASWLWAQRLWEAVASATLETYAHSDAAFKLDFHILPTPGNFEGKPLVAALDAARERLRNGESLPLLERAIAAPEPTVVATPNPFAHRGHLGAYGLTADQRLALAHALALKHSEVHAVTGPPGTGKTMLLRTLVASLFVDAVLTATTLEDATPPLIVVTSANNNAVTNVLNTFDRAVEVSALGRRWIDGCAGYGIYHVAQARADAAEQRHSVLRKAGANYGGQVVNLAQPGVVGNLERVFLERFQAALGERPETIDAAVAILGNRVRQWVAELGIAIHARDAFQHIVREAKTAGEARDILARRLNARIDEIAEQRANAVAPLEALERYAASETKRLDAASGALDPYGWYEDWFSWLDGVKRRRWRRFAEAWGPEAPSALLSVSELEALIIERRRSLSDEIARSHAAIVFLEKDLAAAEQERASRLAQFDAIVADWNGVCERAHECGDDPAVYRDDLSRADALFDRLYRAAAARFAMRFWEGRFIQEVRRARERRNDVWLGQDRERVLRRLKLIAMLHPVSVVTIHSLASRFDAWNRALNRSEPLFDAIDWVIVDEAAQVGPDLAGAALPLARRLLAVGDTWQLQPIFTADEGLARANVRGRFGDVDAWEALERYGALAYERGNGSAMRFAQAAVARTGPDQSVAGSILTSHFRCVPEIIAYPNELVYRHIKPLEPMRPALIDATLPAMGHAHVRGRSIRRAGSSRANEAEAQILVQFLVDRRQMILTRYRVATLAQAVAIVTPFAAQSALIERLFDAALRACGAPPEPDLAIGTVFRLQGAEAKIILYSHVVDAQDQSGYVDSKPNLLNVAVSRAEDHFLFFGDLAAIDGRSLGTPTGLLAAHLLSKSDNGLSGIPTSFYGAKADIQRVATLQAHVALLDEALETAREEVFIVSPFLGANALETDNLLGRIRTTVMRSVCVRVFTDAEWLRRTPGLEQVVRDTGADVGILRRIHAKTLAIDERMLYEGSFNWLGARRDDLARQEAGWVVRGAAASAAVKEVRAYFSALRNK